MGEWEVTKRIDGQSWTIDGERKRDEKRYGILLIGGILVISIKGEIPKNWEKLFYFYY
jgi:hypothetical protein